MFPCERGDIKDAKTWKENLVCYVGNFYVVESAGGSCVMTALNQNSYSLSADSWVHSLLDVFLH